jgi:hypothetical protein
LEQAVTVAREKLQFRDPVPVLVRGFGDEPVALKVSATDGWLVEVMSEDGRERIRVPADRVFRLNAYLICEVLGLNVSAIRAGIRACRDRPLPTTFGPGLF